MSAKSNYISRILIVLSLSFNFSVFGQEIVGHWKTIDDETKKERSIVEIYKVGDNYGGRLLDSKGLRR